METVFLFIDLTDSGVVPVSYVNGHRIPNRQVPGIFFLFLRTRHLLLKMATQGLRI